MGYAKLLHVPLLFSYHTHLPIYARDYLGFIPGIIPFTNLVVRWTHNMADLVVVTSPQLADELRSFGVKEVGVWAKGIDTKKFQPKYKNQHNMRNRLTNNNPEDPLLIYVGRLGTEKKLKILRNILKKYPTIRLAFVGTGPAEEELKEYYISEGNPDTEDIRNRVVFTGVLHGEELSAAFASGDIFCMPSDSETLGFVVLESMASGVPVIGCRAGGIPNLIEDGVNGYLVDIGDENKWLEYVDELIFKNPEKRIQMGKAGREEAEKWSWEAATQNLREEHYLKTIFNFENRRNRLRNEIKKTLLKTNQALAAFSSKMFGNLEKRNQIIKQYFRTMRRNMLLLLFGKQVETTTPTTTTATTASSSSTTPS